MVAPRWRLRRTTMQSRGPHPRSGWRPSERAGHGAAGRSRPRRDRGRGCWQRGTRAGGKRRQRRAYALGRECRAHRGLKRRNWPLARCRDREQGRMPRSRQYTCSPHLANMCRGLSPQTIKLLYCGAASPCSFPSRLDTNGVRCELESFTRSPDPSFSSSARELAATRRTFGAQKRAITASHRLSP